MSQRNKLIIMETQVKTQEDKKALYVKLLEEVTSLKKRMADRKSDWKLFKSKFKDDYDKIEKTLKKLIANQKK